MYPQHDTACVSEHECDLCHLFYIPIVYQLLSNQSNQRMEFIVILFRLKLVKNMYFQENVTTKTFGMYQL